MQLNTYMYTTSRSCPGRRNFPQPLYLLVRNEIVKKCNIVLLQKCVIVFSYNVKYVMLNKLIDQVIEVYFNFMGL